MSLFFKLLLYSHAVLQLGILFYGNDYRNKNEIT